MRAPDKEPSARLQLVNREDGPTYLDVEGFADEGVWIGVSEPYSSASVQLDRAHAIELRNFLVELLGAMP